MLDVIIPCLNEEKTIGALVRTFQYHPLIGHVNVVIDEATTDNTRVEVLDQGYGNITRIIWGKHGKGQNIKIGLHYVETERVILCDGDLTGFMHEHIDTLTGGLSPFVIGVPDFPLIEIMESPKMTMTWMPRVFETFPWVSGERTVITEVIRKIDLHGYLAEVQINAAYKALGIRPDFRFLSGVHSPFNMTDQRMADMERDRKWGIEHDVFTDGDLRRTGHIPATDRNDGISATVSVLVYVGMVT